MVSLNISQLRLNISEFISRVVYSGERFAIKRNGKPACAIVSIEDLKLLEALEDKLDLEAAKKALQKNDTVSWEKARKELGL